MVPRGSRGREPLGQSMSIFGTNFFGTKKDDVNFWNQFFLGTKKKADINF